MQLSVFNIPIDKPVNVSAVKHRSPFRYPGGKTWFTPRVFKWLSTKENKPKEFIEPFAGGAIVGLSVAFENLADHITLAELDNQVASVWEVIIQSNQAEWLARKIEEFDFNSDNVSKVLETPASNLREAAFQTIIQNRANRGGILAKGAGKIKNGEKGKGIASRWYPQTLAKRIRDIKAVSKRLTFIHGDGFDVVTAKANLTNVVFFIDPPYTAGNGKRAGTRLYTHFNIDHERLFTILEEVKGDFILTYDDDKYIRELANIHRFEYSRIAMHSTHHAEMRELVIGRDLSWLG